MNSHKYQLTLLLSANSMDFTKMQLQFPMLFVTMYGNVSGTLEIKDNIIIFTPNVDSVTEVLVATTTKRDRDITPDVIDRFRFRIHFEDLFTTKVIKQSGQALFTIYLFGLSGIDPPVKDGIDQLGLITVQLAAPEKIPNLEVIKDQIRELIHAQYATMGSIVYNLSELFTHVLKLNRYQNNGHIFRRIMKNTSNEQMKCISQISLYDVVSYKSIMNKMPFHAHQFKFKAPKLMKPTSIMTPLQFEQICKHLPQNVQFNDWHLVYDSLKHGHSTEQLFKRCYNIQEHILIIKDDHHIVFGAYLEQGWSQKGVKYYGSLNSFVFTFYGETKFYGCTDMDQCIQLSNEVVAVGGDSHAIVLKEDLSEGESNYCQTFNNKGLTTHRFKVAELEVWGIGDKTEFLLRQQRIDSQFGFEL